MAALLSAMENLLYSSRLYGRGGAALRADIVETLGKLRPAFAKDGSVTAGNASGINDGAAAVVVMSAAEAQRRSVTGQLRLRVR